VVSRSATHYNAGSKEYGLDHKDNVLFKKLDFNPFFNDFGIYMLDQLHTFQNMQGYAVDATTKIDAYVREKTTLHDGTVINRFPKELLADIETLVAFSPWYRQDDPRTAGALDEFYNTALQDYSGIKYDDLHE
jgi:hypothetical protein